MHSILRWNLFCPPTLPIPLHMLLSSFALFFLFKIILCFLQSRSKSVIFAKKCSEIFSVDYY